MKPITKMKLSQLGFEGKEIDALDKIIDLTRDINLVNDSDERSSEIVKRLRQDNLSLSNELAILRKTLKLVCEKLNINYDEFIQYNEIVDNAKRIKELERGEEI